MSRRAGATGNQSGSARGGALRDRNFRLYWTGQTISQLGTAVTGLALPLTALGVLHASAFVVGLLEAAVWLPWLFLGLPVGVWVDRLPRRKLMVVCDAVCFLLLASVPAAAWCGVLSEYQLVGVALLVGAVSVLFATARQVYLPVIVDESLLGDANAKSQGAATTVGLLGSGVGGLLASLVGAATAVFSDAVSYLVSAVCLLAIPVEDRPSKARERTGGAWSEAREGLSAASRDPYLRSLVAYSGLGNLCTGAYTAVVVVFLVRTVGVSSFTAGGLLALSSLGGVAGAAAAQWLSDRLGSAHAMLVSEFCSVPFMLLMPVAERGPALAFFVVGVLVWSTGTTLSNVIISTFLQRYVPRHMLGRVAAIMSVVSYGSIPLGAVSGGFFATEYGARTAMWLATGAQVLSLSVLLAGSLRRDRDLPTAKAAVAAATAAQET